MSSAEFSRIPCFSLSSVVLRKLCYNHLTSIILFNVFIIMVDDVICYVLNLDLFIAQFMTVKTYYKLLCGKSVLWLSGIADIGV